MLHGEMASLQNVLTVVGVNLCLHVPLLLAPCEQRVSSSQAFARLVLSSAFLAAVRTAYDPARSPPLVPLLPLQLGAMLVLEDACIKWSSRALSSRVFGSWRPGSLSCALPFSLFAPLERASVLDWLAAGCGVAGAVRLVRPSYAVACCWVLLRHLEARVSAGVGVGLVRARRAAGASDRARAPRFRERIALALLESSERVVGWVQAAHGDPNFALPLSALLPRILALGTGAHHSLDRDQRWVLQLRYALLVNAVAMVFERNRLFTYDSVAATLMLLALPAEWLTWCAYP